MSRECLRNFATAYASNYKIVSRIYVRFLFVFENVYVLVVRSKLYVFNGLAAFITIIIISKYKRLSP